MNSPLEERQYDAHVRSYDIEMRVRRITESSERVSLLGTVGWEAAEQFTEGTLDDRGVGYYRDTDAGRITASVYMKPVREEARWLLAQYPNIPADPKMLIFYLGTASLDNPTVPHTRVYLGIVPLDDGNFRVFSFGFSEHASSFIEHLPLLEDIVHGIDDFMTRVATRNGKICTVFDTSDTFQVIDMLMRTGFSVKDGVSFEMRDGCVRKDVREVLQAVHTLVAHNIQLGDSLTDGFRLLQLNGWPYSVQLEKKYHPLKADTHDALFERAMLNDGLIT